MIFDPKKQSRTLIYHFDHKHESITIEKNNSVTRRYNLIKPVRLYKLITFISSEHFCFWSNKFLATHKRLSVTASTYTKQFTGSLIRFKRFRFVVRWDFHPDTTQTGSDLVKCSSIIFFLAKYNQFDYWKMISSFIWPLKTASHKPMMKQRHLPTTDIFYLAA